MTGRPVALDRPPFRLVPPAAAGRRKVTKMTSMRSPKRRSRFALLTLVALTLGTILLSAPTASAQFGYGRGGYSRGYGGFNRGFGGFNRGYGGFNRGLTNGGGFNGGLYNRGYGGYGYGPGLYNRGYGGLNIGVGVAPFINPPIYGPSYYGGYY